MSSLGILLVTTLYFIAVDCHVPRLPSPDQTCRLSHSTAALQPVGQATVHLETHGNFPPPAVSDNHGMEAFCGAESGRCCSGMSRHHVRNDLRSRYMDQVHYQLRTLRAEILQSANFAIQDWQMSAFHKIIDKVQYPSSLGRKFHLIKKAIKSPVCSFPLELSAHCGDMRMIRSEIESFLTKIYFKVLLASSTSHGRDLKQSATECLHPFAEQFMKQPHVQELIDELTCTIDALVCEPQTILEGNHAAQYILESVSRTEPTQDCLEGLARLWHCPYCSGRVHAHVPPCQSMCFNVIRGCLGHLDHLANSLFAPTISMVRDRILWLNQTQTLLETRAANAISQFVQEAHRSTFGIMGLVTMEIMCGTFQENSATAVLRPGMSCPFSSGTVTLNDVLYSWPGLISNTFDLLDLFVSNDLCPSDPRTTHCHNGLTNDSYTAGLYTRLPGTGLTSNPEVRQQPPVTQYTSEISMFHLAVENLRFPKGYLPVSYSRPRNADRAGTGGPSSLVVEVSGDGLLADDEDIMTAASGSGSGDLYTPKPTASPRAICKGFPDYTIHHTEPTRTPPATRNKIETIIATTKQQQPTTAARTTLLRTTLPVRTRATTPKVAIKPTTVSLQRTRSPMRTTSPIDMRTTETPLITTSRGQGVLENVTSTRKVDLKQSSAASLHLSISLVALSLFFAYFFA